jgi:hypothetical protein
VLSGNHWREAQKKQGLHPAEAKVETPVSVEDAFAHRASRHTGGYRESPRGIEMNGRGVERNEEGEVPYGTRPGEAADANIGLDRWAVKSNSRLRHGLFAAGALGHDPQHVGDALAELLLLALDQPTVGLIDTIDERDRAGGDVDHQQMHVTIAFA